jgi:ribosomal protein L32
MFNYEYDVPFSFGSGQVTVSKYMAPICSLLGDANSQVRSCAMETIVNIYRHVGVKVRIDVSRRNLQQSHLAKLNAQFDAVDATTGNSKSDNEVCLCVPVCDGRVWGGVCVCVCVSLGRCVDCGEWYSIG